ncbi:MAG: T9SS type A sorting domain-containing protein [Flavobacteriales bacterium]|nr:T9SS type A sorting domain-containing protein [Flavobacteriales bacterium]
MQKQLLLPLTAFIVFSISLSPAIYAQTNAGVSAVLDPVSGSTLIIGSSFPVTAQVFNNGTTTITSMQLKFNIGINNTVLDEIWTGSFAPGDTITYTFNAQFTLNDTISGSSVYCLADAPNDNMPSNNSAYPVYSFAGSTGLPGMKSKNRDKLAFDHFIVIPGHQVRFGLVNSSNYNSAIVAIVGMDGKYFNSQTATSSNKWGQFVLDLSSLPKGLYIVVIQTTSERLTKKFVI